MRIYNLQISNNIMIIQTWPGQPDELIWWKGQLTPRVHPSKTRSRSSQMLVNPMLQTTFLIITGSRLHGSRWWDSFLPELHSTMICCGRAVDVVTYLMPRRLDVAKTSLAAASSIFVSSSGAKSTGWLWEERQTWSPEQLLFLCLLLFYSFKSKRRKISYAFNQSSELALR